LPDLESLAAKAKEWIAGGMKRAGGRGDAELPPVKVARGMGATDVKTEGTRRTGFEPATVRC
jgi:hypothetical protein